MITLDQASAETTNFYRLAVTNETATTNDDIEIFPTSVAYDRITNKAILTFAQDLANYGTGAFDYASATSIKRSKPVR